MHLKIVNPSMAGHTAQVWVDGVSLPDVTEVEVAFKADGHVTATVTRMVESLEVDTEGELRIVLLSLKGNADPAAELTRQAQELGLGYDGDGLSEASRRLGPAGAERVNRAQGSKEVADDPETGPLTKALLSSLTREPGNAS